MLKANKSLKRSITMNYLLKVLNISLQLTPGSFFKNIDNLLSFMFLCLFLTKCMIYTAIISLLK